MKVVILAGGYGTRISEETAVRPKPLVEIGGKPILWHIMKLYGSYGFHDFIVCLGYKGYMVKEYFANYYLHTSDVTFDLKTNGVHVHQSVAEPWRVTLIDTGEGTSTGGRLKRIAPYIGNEPFCMTYGDGVADLRVDELVAFHRSHGKEATVTVVQPPGRFGAVHLQDSAVRRFQEKPDGDNAWISGGFFVLQPSVFERIAGDETVWEREPLEGLAASEQLMAYRHSGFWHAVDTLRDKTFLEALWNSDNAPWKNWP
jgi:glucose-1-phosphate cytidylyltransferase